MSTIETFEQRGQCSSTSFVRRKATQFSPLLQSLYEAMEYAEDLSSSPWDFALMLEQVREFHVSLNDLRWMTRKGWIQHRCVSDSPSRAPATLCFQRESQFIISRRGIEICQVTAEIPDEPRSDVLHLFQETKNSLGHQKPKWDTDRRELSVCGKVVKRFRWPAPNQETILSVFSEEDWPARIEDPLSPGNGLDPKRRLADTIKCLNRNQQENLVRFRGDGTGEGVLWDFTMAASGASPTDQY